MQLIRSLKIHQDRFFLACTAFFILLVYIPEAFTWLTPTQGLVFNGGFLNITDFNVYLSAIRQGSEGKWLFQPQFTPESFSPYFAFAPYILTGKLLSLFGGGILFWYHILKIISLIWAINNLLALVFIIFPNQTTLQKTAFFMLLFSNGIGWLILPFIGELTTITPDLFVPEWNLINASFASPHFLLGTAFQAAFFRYLILFFKKSGWKSAILLALSGLGISLAYPYLTAIDGLILSAYLFYLGINSKSIPWRKILVLGAACIPMILALIYYGFILPQDPLYQLLIITNNEITPPLLLGLIVGYGLLLPLAILGISRWWQKPDSRIIVFWLVTNLIGIYLPLSFSGRFISGLNIPIILLAAYGLETVFLPWANSKLTKPQHTLRNLSILLTIPSTLLFVIYFTVMINTYDIFPYYTGTTEQEAAVWLSEISTDQDLVLAEFPMCNLLPRYGQGRVFNGHFDLTVDMVGKSEMVKTFWSIETSDQWRQNFIDTWDVTYIYQGRYENAHIQGDPLLLPYEIIYQTETDRIYQIP